MVNSISLKVAEAPTCDVGRGIIRIDMDYILKLGIEIGDIVEVRGSRLTSGRVMPTYTDDRGKGIVRMDGIIRENAKVQLESKVEIRKADSSEAREIEIVPVSKSKWAKISSLENQYFKSLIRDRSMSAGDRIRIDLFGAQTLDFYVRDTKPKGLIVIKENTQIIIKEDKKYEHKRKITYEDIGGLSKEIQKIREMIELPLKFPEVFEQLGIEAPKGVLLYGPPGTGKTLIAKAVANETEAHFIHVSGPELINKYYGESEANLRNVFEAAKANLPAIIFLDEIDAIAPKREDVKGDVEKRVVAQLLALMDGIESRGNIIVIGATNLPDTIDPALRRPGRFDREIYIGIPTIKDRGEILKVHTRGMPLCEDVDLQRIALITNGYVGADLEALCKEAAMNSLRKSLPKIDLIKGYIPLEVLMGMKINMECFVDALKEIEPSAIREISVQRPNLSWADMGGLEKIKNEIRYLVEWPFKYRELYQYGNIRRTKGIILHGPPGCGKTLIAKVIASESKCNFVSVKGPELMSKWIGESEKIVRDLFKKARQVSPCIIFFDEIDSIAPKRGRGTNEVADRIVSQLLTEIDGLEELRDVIVIAATNRIDLIDDALLRSGRFETKIKIDMYDYHDRKEIFKIYLNKKICSKDIDIESYAKMTENFSGADIELVCDKAGKIALENLILNSKNDIIDKESFVITHRDIIKAINLVKEDIA